MGLFNKKPDPITDRSRELNAKISALESKIKKLNEEMQPAPGPRLRSTAYPGSGAAPGKPSIDAPPSHEPIFEKVDQNQLKTPAEAPAANPREDDLGVRKYDLPGLWERIKKEFGGPPPANPKLVNYLAAGSIQGLRPLRYEKRVMRNRCLTLAAVFLLGFLGIIYALKHRH